MAITYLDPEPQAPVATQGSGITYLDEAQPETQNAPEAEGAVASFFRPIATHIFPSLMTAAGGILGGTAGTALGLETGPGAIATGIAGDLAGGTAGGALGEKIQSSILGDEYLKQLRAQEEANLKEHPFWARMGTMLGELPSFIGGGPKFAKLDEAGNVLRDVAGAVVHKSPEELSAAERLLHSATSGGRGGGASAVQQQMEGNQNVSIPEEILRGALTFGPTGLVPAAKTLLKAAAVKAPSDAAIMATSNALYDKIVHDKPIDLGELSSQIGSDVPGFVLLNALTHGVHSFPKVPEPRVETPPVSEVPHPLDPVIEQNAELNPKTAEALEKFKEAENQVVAPEPAQAAEPASSAEGNAQPVAQDLEANPTAEPQPVEEENATPTQQIQAGVPEQPEGGIVSGETPEAGVGDSLLRPAEIPPEGTHTQPFVEPSKTSKIMDYGEDGTLSEEVELPHDEAVKKLSLREKALNILKECMEKAA